jgi:hypothetical protein
MVVVAAHPVQGVRFDREMGLLKAALLQGDRLTLISPSLTTLTRLRGSGDLTAQHEVDVARQVAPYLFEDLVEAAQDEIGLRQMGGLLRQSLRASGQPGARQARARAQVCAMMKTGQGRRRGRA